MNDIVTVMSVEEAVRFIMESYKTAEPAVVGYLLRNPEGQEYQPLQVRNVDVSTIINQIVANKRNENLKHP